MIRDPLECEALVIRTRARAAQAGTVLAPRGFDFVVNIMRFDGENLPEMAVQDVGQVAKLIADLTPERVSVEVAAHEDVNLVRAALGVADTRTLH